MIVQVKGFWDAAFSLGVPAVAVVVGASGYAYLQKRFEKEPETKPVNGNGASGAKPVDFWKSEFRSIVSESVKDHVLPILHAQTEILRETKDVQRDMEKAITRLTTLAEIRDRRSGT